MPTNVSPWKDQTTEQLERCVGKRVVKNSGKPFKSGDRVGTVQAITTHPDTKRAAFVMKEDGSVVEAGICLPSSGWTDEEFAEEYGYSLDSVRRARQELAENTPRAQRVRAQLAAAFEEAEKDDFEGDSYRLLRELFAPPRPKVKPETVNNIMGDIKLMKRAKEMGG